jgi:hypothetical protein
MSKGKKSQIAIGNWNQFEPVTKLVVENKTSSGKHG